MCAEKRFLTVFSSYCIVQYRRSRYVVVWEGKSRLQQPLELQIIENCNLGMLALLGVSNAGMGELSAPQRSHPQDRRNEHGTRLAIERMGFISEGVHRAVSQGDREIQGAGDAMRGRSCC